MSKRPSRHATQSGDANGQYGAEKSDSSQPQAVNRFADKQAQQSAGEQHDRNAEQAVDKQ